MKKTTTINLAGMVFHIEENGYLLLQKYFDDLKRVFSNEEGLDEMVSDIESRFAELFHDRLHTHKEVVTEEDVIQVVNIMGSPNQYDETFDEADTFEESDYQSFTNERRLYRDTDDAVIAGVASGTAHYFGIDPVIVRILWIIFFFLGGSGILIYIIAWIAIPEAKTTAQKIQMHGKTPNLDNFKSYMDKATSETKKGYDRAKSSVEKSWNSSQDAVRKTTRIFGNIFGTIMILIGITGLGTIGMLFFLKFSKLTVNNELVDTDLSSINSLIFVNETLAFWLLLIIASIPILFFVTIGAKLIFRQLKVRALNWVLLIIWFLSIIGISILGVKTGVDFKESYFIEEQTYIEDDIDELSLYLFEDEIEITNSLDYEFENFISITDDEVKLGYINIEIESTKDSLFHYKVEKSSKGNTLKSAKTNAEDIKVDVLHKNGEMTVDTRYIFSRENRFRDQKVKLIIYVPIEKQIVVNGNLEDYPIRIKTSRLFSKDDVEQTSIWKATERGMEFVR